VKFLLNERGSPAANDLVASDAELIAPDWLTVEVARALQKAVADGRIDEAAARRGLDGLPRYFDELVPAAGLLARAIDLAFSMTHPVYDCLYLALALDERAVLVTADERLVSRCVATGYGDRVRLLAQS